MTNQEIGKKRAIHNFDKKKNASDNYLKGIVKNCTESIAFRKKESFAKKVEWSMRAFSMDKKTAIKFQNDCISQENAYDKKLVQLATNELNKRRELKK